MNISELCCLQLLLAQSLRSQPDAKISANLTHTHPPKLIAELLILTVIKSHVGQTVTGCFTGTCKNT